MKITFISHASILVESNGVRILSDPWWKGPCFGAQWWLYPEPYLEAVKGQNIDYVYVSHGHHDHFHPQTLNTLSRTAKVLVANGSHLYEPIRDLGFKVLQVSQNDERHLDNGISCRIIETEGNDTMMVISDGQETCLNINDALHSLPDPARKKFTHLLKKHYPSIDYVFCGYGTASHFPNCYVIPHMNRERTAAKRQHYFNRAWSDIVHNLTPRFAFPFAAGVVFLQDDLFWSNEPIHNSQRPTDVFKQEHPDSSTTVVDIAPGFIIENGTILVDSRRGPLSNHELRKSYHDSIKKVNRPSPIDDELVKEVAKLLEQNVEKCYDFLGTYEGDYRCVVKIRNADEAILLTKRGPQLSVTTIRESSCKKDDYDLLYTTRLSYLKKSLTTSYGHEILFVGSGGIFQYTDEAKVASNIHQELIVALRKTDKCPEARRGQPQGFVVKAKQLVKRLMGHTEVDLYDLRSWVEISN